MMGTQGNFEANQPRAKHCCLTSQCKTLLTLLTGERITETRRYIKFFRGFLPNKTTKNLKQAILGIPY